MENSKKTVTAIFPGGIGKVEISIERAQQILRLQKLIREQQASRIQHPETSIQHPTSSIQP
jgi:hypothetical protein